jgi:hypothetical protein
MNTGRVGLARFIAGIMPNKLSILSKLSSVSAPVLILAMATSAQTGRVEPRIAQAISSTARVTIPHSTHPLAQPAYDVGRLDGATPMERMTLILDGSPEQDYELKTLLDSQQTAGSPDYHKWITPDQFGQKFGPAPEDIQAVTGWLQQQGFTVGSVARSGRWIEFSGSSAQVETAFQTQMHRYQVNGEAHVANSTDISIPVALTPVVRGVVSLNNFFTKPAFVQGPLVQRMPDGTFTTIGASQTGGVNTLSPADFAKIYDVPNLLLSPAPATVLNGTGETIAIVARSNINPQDVADFRSLFGLGTGTPNIILNGPDPGVVESGEPTLDTEWSSATAPGATIDLVISASTLIMDGEVLSASYIVDHNLAPILSASTGVETGEVCGGVEFGLASFLDAIEQQAAAQGISVFISSGDDGAANCDPNAPVPQPGATGGVAISALVSPWYVTAVGGTEFNESISPGTNFWKASNGTNDESAAGYIPEMVWNDSCSNGCQGGEDSLEAGGGGVSVLYATPPYQTLSIAGLPAAVSASPHPGNRAMPDVALTASTIHDPYLFCISAHGSTCESASPILETAGGTSSSTPSFAGIMALVDQKVGQPQGLANYVLYSLAAASTIYNNGSGTCNSSTRTNPATATACIFNDIMVGTNGVPGNDITNDPTAGALGYPAGIGYDLATGLGSVDANNMINAWAAAAAAFLGSKTAITSTTPTPINITHGTSVSLSATVTRLGATGTPTGTVGLLAQGGSLTSPVGVGSSVLTSGTNCGATPGCAGATASTISNLPGGTYNLVAIYPGDGTFAGSTSSSVSVTVAKEPCAIHDTVSPTVSGSPVPYGTAFTFDAQIKGQSGNGVATGNASLTDTVSATTTTLETLALSDDEATGAGEAEFTSCLGGATPNCLAAGSTHAINVSYPGDNSFLAGNTNTMGQTATIAVVSATTTTTVSCTVACTHVTPTTPVTLTAAVATVSNGAAPNGTVQFFSNGSALGSPVTVTGTAGTKTSTSNGVPAGATASLSIDLPAGTDNITAQYSGDTPDTNYSGSTSPAIVITSGSGVQTFSVTANPTNISVVQGATGPTVLTFTSMDGLTGTLQVTATFSGLPNASNLSFSSTSVTNSTTINLPANGTTTATIYFSTTAPKSGGIGFRPEGFGWRKGRPAILICLGVLLLLLRRRQLRWSAVLALLAFAFILGSVACGGGSGGSFTPVGGPTSVTAKITVDGITQTVPNLTVTVTAAP